MKVLFQSGLKCLVFLQEKDNHFYIVKLMISVIKILLENSEEILKILYK